jgi:3-deoxy-manno-octulosonate cytidylyltransferase (CMP-KDO synthetase)
MKTLIAIPPAMPLPATPANRLVSLRGPDGEKTLIRRSWEAATAVKGIDRVVVATDDDRIADHAAAFGAEVVMTSSEAAQRHRTLRRGGRETAWLRRDRQPAGRRAPDPRLVRRGPGQGPERTTPGPTSPPPSCAAMAGRMVAGLPGRPPRTGACRRHDRRLRGRRPRALLLQGSHPLTPAAAMRPMIRPRLPPCRRLRLSPCRPAGLSLGWPIGPLETLEGLEQLRFLEQGRPVLCVEVEGERAASSGS